MLKETDTYNTVPVPAYVVQEVLEDGACPLHLRFQLNDLLHKPSMLCSHSIGVLFSGLDGQCLSTVTTFLPLAGVLATRAASRELLHYSMQKPRTDSGCSEGGSSATNSRRLLRSSSAAASTGLVVHNRIRARLWLQRVEELVSGSADETVFESRARSLVDQTLRRRLEEEVAATKQGMTEEVRVAKMNMLQCVQAISEEVDRRVQEKVGTLQGEFDRRTAEQETRIIEQATALQAEVDERTSAVRESLQLRTREQEEKAEQLHMEIAHIREAFEKRVQEQEIASRKMNAELESLRSQLADVTCSRASLERKVLEQELAVAQLEAQLSVLRDHRSALCTSEEQRVCRQRLWHCALPSPLSGLTLIFVTALLWRVRNSCIWLPRLWLSCFERGKLMLYDCVL